MATGLLEEIEHTLLLHCVSPEDLAWVKENFYSKQLNILSAHPPNDFFIFSDEHRRDWILSVAEYLVQNGKVVSREEFNPRRRGLVIIRPGVIHMYIA